MHNEPARSNDEQFTFGQRAPWPLAERHTGQQQRMARRDFDGHTGEVIGSGRRANALMG